MRGESPGFVGTRGATAAVRDGARVWVDGGTGRVEILADQAS